MPDETILKVQDLSTSFGRGEAEVKAVQHISFEIARGETLAVVANPAPARV